MAKNSNNVMQKNKQDIERSLANAPLSKKIGYWIILYFTRKYNKKIFRRNDNKNKS